LLTFLIVCLAFTSSLFAVDASHVTLVINESSPLSRRIGAFYAEWHKLSPQQICRITSTDNETTTRAKYEAEIATPISNCLRRARRVEDTYYLVLTQGLPIRVQAQSKDDGASVDSELALLYLELHGARIRREGHIENPFFRSKDQPFTHPAVPLYLVTRLAGYSFEDMKRSVERCRIAKNQGRVVLDLKADNDEDGNSWLRNAGIVLPENRVLMDVSPEVVQQAKDVISYASWGSNDRGRKSRKSGMQWLPGAIATEFVSSNGRTLKMPPYNWTLGDWKDQRTYFAGSPQSMILDYVWEGVSGIAGNIDEPFLSTTVRPDLLFPAYLNGRNLAESFYLALPVLSWQSIIIGDPLCRLE
jgi:uncharacterized protein (TIGR03790 family)